MLVYMRTAKTGLIWSCSGAVWANLVLFRAKRVGEHSFLLVIVCLMYLHGSDAKTVRGALIFPFYDVID